MLKQGSSVTRRNEITENICWLLFFFQISIINHSNLRWCPEFQYPLLHVAMDFGRYAYRRRMCCTATVVSCTSNFLFCTDLLLCIHIQSISVLLLEQNHIRMAAIMVSMFFQRYFSPIQIRKYNRLWLKLSNGNYYK